MVGIDYDRNNKNKKQKKKYPEQIWNAFIMVFAI